MDTILAYYSQDRSGSNSHSGQMGGHLEQCINLQSSPVGEQLAAILGPLEFTSDKVDVPNIGIEPVHIQ
jgi:hypothetical protein